LWSILITLKGGIMGSEKQFENKVKAYLKDKGCWVLKTWSNGVQREGVPDLLVCCNGYFLGIELKAETGHPTKLQEWNVDRIRKAGGMAIVLYPDKFYMLKDLIDDLNNDQDLEWWLNHQYFFQKGW
jgi:hypothetical protein